MHVSARVAPVGEAFRQVRNMQGDEVFFSLYNTGGVSDHHPRLETIMKIQRQWYFTPASLAPTSPASSTSLLFSLKTLSLASPRQWGWMMQQQDSFRCHVIRELSKISLLISLFPRRYFILLFLKQEAAEETWALGLPWDFPVGEDCNLCMCHCAWFPQKCFMS